jgi:hypothetical protein
MTASSLVGWYGASVAGPICGVVLRFAVAQGVLIGPLGSWAPGAGSHAVGLSGSWRRGGEVSGDRVEVHQRGGPVRL